MNDKITRELPWLLGVTILSVLTSFLLLGNKFFDLSPVDIQLHDTYYVIPKLIFLLIILMVLLTFTYLIRAFILVFTKWRSKT